MRCKRKREVKDDSRKMELPLPEIGKAMDRIGFVCCLFFCLFVLLEFCFCVCFLVDRLEVQFWTC